MPTTKSAGKRPEGAEGESTAAKRHASPETRDRALGATGAGRSANLKPNTARTPDQLKAMGAKGGKASGETRKKRKAAKDLAKLVLGLNVTTTAKTKKALKKLGYDVDAEGAPSVELMMQIAIANQAMSGDLASAKFLYDYAQVPDIRTQLERERIKATVDARQKVDLTVNSTDADCLTEIRQRMLTANPKESLPQAAELPVQGKVDFPENACIVPGKTDEVPDANDKEQEPGVQESEMPETASSIPHSSFLIPHSPAP